MARLARAEQLADIRFAISSMPPSPADGTVKGIGWLPQLLLTGWMSTPKTADPFRYCHSCPESIPAYATLDLRVGYETPDKRWRTMVFTRNVFNKYYIVNVIPGADTSARVTGQPVTYGVTVGFKM